MVKLVTHLPTTWCNFDYFRNTRELNEFFDARRKENFAYIDCLRFDGI